MANSIDLRRHDSEINSLISKMSLEEKAAMIHASQKFESGSVQRLGISGLKLTDGPHGIRPELIPDVIAFTQAAKDDDFSLYLPTEIALASTWNISLAHEYGRALAIEAKARGKEVLLGPGINIIRTPLNGRNFEYLSEDPFLTRSMAVPYIHGVQGEGIAACAKHLVANNQEHERFTVSVEMSDRALNEIYLPAFKAAVEEGQVLTIMGAYNQFRGQYCCHNNVVVNDILKVGWGFDGLVMSDWNGTHDTVEAGNNGLDLEMGTEQTWDQYYMAKPLIQAVNDGQVPEKNIDDKVRRVMRVMFFTRGVDSDAQQVLDIGKHHQLALDVARESIVLLKNEGDFLPLDLAGFQRIAVIGANATRTHAIEGGSSQVKARYEMTPLEGIQCHFADNDISFAKGYSENPADDQQALQQEAVGVAARADVVIFVGGLNHTAHDREYFDRADMNLPYGQDELIKAIAAANTRIAVVLVSGSPLEMCDWLDDVPAVLQNWYNGMEGGNALAEVLLGECNPSGKLPVTFPKCLYDSPAHATSRSYPGDAGSVYYDEAHLVGYRYFDTYEVEPEFCFGHGLSYTSFDYRNLQLSAARISADTKELEVGFEICNSGSVTGAEIVQLYISTIASQANKAAKELKAFTKVRLRPGESESIDMVVHRDEFRHFDEEKEQWVLESGRYKVLIGASSRDIRLTALLDVC